MISCKDARHLFDRYLDGELAASLQTELHAHRLNCTECQNELAMMEACGDVVALDRREPVLSASFTNRVLLARRAQLRPQRRPWGRTLLLVGSPMAAAASIALAVLLIAPTATKTPFKSMVKGNVTKVEEVVAIEPVLSSTQSPADVLDKWILSGLVQKSCDTVSGARKGAEELAHLIHLGLSDANDQLAAKWRMTAPASGAPEAPAAPAPMNAPKPAEPELPNCALEPL